MNLKNRNASKSSLSRHLTYRSTKDDSFIPTCINKANINNNGTSVVDEKNNESKEELLNSKEVKLPLERADGSSHILAS
jgi:hypothetical protein